MSSWRSPTKRRKKARRDCARKVAHPTLQEAQDAMDEVVAAGRASPQCRAYACPLCGAYHWGHPSGLNGGVGGGRSHVSNPHPPP